MFGLTQRLGACQFSRVPSTYIRLQRKVWERSFADKSVPKFNTTTPTPNVDKTQVLKANTTAPTPNVDKTQVPKANTTTPTPNVDKTPTGSKAEVRYHNLSKLASVIIPVNANEKCAFPLYPNMTLKSLLSMIREERNGSTTDQIFVTDEAGVRVSPSADISDLIKSPFVINVNNDKFHVPAVNAEKPVTDTVLGTPEIRDLTLKAYHLKIQERLKEQRRYHMPYSEYLKLCDSYGLTDQQARDLSKAMHMTGDVLHFHSNAELSHLMFLKPEMVTRTLAQSLDLKFMTRGVPILLQKLNELLPEYLPLNQKKLELDVRAQASAARWMRGGFLYLVLQFGFLARCVWIDFNWDIMEPITYFVSLSTLMLGYMFFVLYREEYTYNALEERQRSKALRKLYIKEEFNWKRWHELHKQVEDLKDLLGHANIPEELKHSSQKAPVIPNVHLTHSAVA